MNIAVVENQKIVNVIIADTVEIAESLTGLECFEINQSNPEGINWEWNDSANCYVPPKDYPSWILNVSKKVWEAPTPIPVTEGVMYIWTEDSLSWVEQ